MKLTDNTDKQNALDLAEDSREKEWLHASFVAELFKGSFRWDLIHPYPVQSAEDKAIGDLMLADLETVLKTHVDPEKVDEDQELPTTAIQALAQKGFFGMKIPKEYGGLGLSIFNYTRAMALVGSYCGSTAVWLSAHQSIGVPQPVMLFGTDQQKSTYLPRLAKGAISAFALTEPEVGSDPARMSTTATLSEDGEHYLLNGEKLYITNGAQAELLVVMALTKPKIINGKEKKQISAFIVETNSPGFEVIHRCRFMGIRGIANGKLRFTNVKIPKDSIIGEPGQGLKIALVTLNSGRLTIPAISAAAGKLCLHVSKIWSNERVQWGLPIGRHQAVEKKLAQISADTFAMDSVSTLTSAFADNHLTDIRLEAAMAKYFGSERSWFVADETLQIRGGRGYETASSLSQRGEKPYPIERLLRDLRINRIIEGTSEVMQLFIAREAMDIHVKTIMALLSPDLSLGKKIGILAKAGLFYLTWYPKLWVSLPRSYKVSHLNRVNQAHLSFINTTCKQLARRLFHTMARYQLGLEKQQLIMACYVDIGTDLFAMAASLSNLENLLKEDPCTYQPFQDVVDLFCQESKKRIQENFKKVSNPLAKKYAKVSTHLLKGSLDAIVTGIIKP